MLYGIRPQEQTRLASLGHPVRIYVAYGQDWYGYFTRRLAERPANLLFFLALIGPVQRRRGPPYAEEPTVDGITHPPTPVNEPVLDYAPGSPERADLVAALGDVHRRRWSSAAVIGGESRRPSGEPFEVVAPHDHRRVLATSASLDPGRRGRRHRGRAGGRGGLAGPRLRLPGGDPAARGRAALRPVAGPDQRRHHAGPVEDRLSGGDRLGLRAGRLLAVQRALRPADPGRAADRQLARASGTAPTTARSRASSTR